MDHPPAGGPAFYNRQGERIDLSMWLKLHRQRDYVVVEQTALEGNGLRILVSTIWRGIADGVHATFFPNDPPLGLYETRVFGGPLDNQEERWATEDGAQEGHRKTVEVIRYALDEGLWWST